MFEILKADYMKPIEKSSAVFLIIAGLLMGTIFMVDVTYYKKQITEDQAIPATANYLSYSNKKEGSVVWLYFSDFDTQTVDASCVTTRFLKQLDQIKPGSKMDLLLHPNSDTVLQITIDGETILDFSETMEEIHRSEKQFAFFAVLMYTFAILGGIKLIRREVF